MSTLKRAISHDWTKNVYGSVYGELTMSFLILPLGVTKAENFQYFIRNYLSNPGPKLGQVQILLSPVLLP